MADFHWNAVCIDCGPGEFEEVVAFYVAMLGLEVAGGGDRWKMLLDASGGMGINVQAEDWYETPVWPEMDGLRSKMMHFEVQVDDVADAVAAAVQLGASEASRQPTTRDPARLRVMLDPAGHPFCLWS